MNEYESIIRKERLSHADKVRLAELRIAADKRPKTEWTVEPIPESQTLAHSLKEIEKLGVGMKEEEKTIVDEARLALEKLRKPFNKNQISLLPKPTRKENKKGKCKECGGYHGLPAVHISYVGHAALTDRLLDVDPFWNWEPVKTDENGFPVIDEFGGMWIRLTVCGLTRLGYGDAGGKKGADANKERIGDALRNAAMRFGAALDLWHKGDLHIPPTGEEVEESEDDLLSRSVDWINSFIERKASVEFFDEKMRENQEKFSLFSEENRQTIAAQIRDVREYLVEQEQEQEKPEVDMTI